MVFRFIFIGISDVFCFSANKFILANKLDLCFFGYFPCSVCHRCCSFLTGDDVSRNGACG